jgi:hypothetical protein
MREERGILFRSTPLQLKPPLFLNAHHSFDHLLRIKNPRSSHFACFTMNSTIGVESSSPCG